MELPLEAGSLHAGWGQSPSDIYAVGIAYWYVHSRDFTYEGSITHFDGESFKVTSTPENHVLTGVWGRSSSDISVTGSNGILHYDGAKWRPMEFGD